MIFRASHTRAWRAPLLLFIGVYLFSGLSPRATSFDSRWSVYIAMSLWDHADTNLDEYPAAIGTEEYALECVDSRRSGEHRTCRHAAGTGTTAIPLEGLC